jgi:hypothetical protein
LAGLLGEALLIEQHPLGDADLVEAAGGFTGRQFARRPGLVKA